MKPRRPIRALVIIVRHQAPEGKACRGNSCTKSHMAFGIADRLIRAGEAVQDVRPRQRRHSRHAFDSAPIRINFVEC